MPAYRLSNQARKDLGHIARYTQIQWGEAQAKKYIRELEACFALLSERPHIGREVKDARKGGRRMEQGKHVIFYRVERDGVVIRKILHEKMLSHLHNP